MKSPVKFLTAALLVLASIGCASPWEKNFHPNRALAGQPFTATGEVQIRTVEYERFRQYAQAERERRIQSATNPADLPAAERLASENRLLDALQIPDRAGDVVVLGWSEFTATDKLDPYGKDLREFATKIGADYAVVTSVYSGPVTTVVREPVTTYSHGYTTRALDRRGRGRGRTLSYSDTSTTWVPMQITEDSYFYQAFFLRRLRPGEQLPVD